MLLTVLACAAPGALASDARVDLRTVQVASTPMLADPYPLQTTAFDGGVVGKPDLVYAAPRGFRPLRMDIYLPGGASASRAYPLVVYIHGGGWQSGHTRHSGAFADWPRVLALLARRGYVVASIEYRLSGEARFPAAVEDVKTSIRWLRAHAREYGIDRSRAVVWGGSAGGHLAALAATTCGVAELTPKLTGEAPFADPSADAMNMESDCVQGLVAWYGVFDFRSIKVSAQQPVESSPHAKFLGCPPESCRDTAALASPIAHLDPRDPRALLIHGDSDRVVPVTQSRAFQRALEEQGVQSRLIVLPDVDHSFIGASAADTRAASIEALSATFEFIDAAIGVQQP